MSQETQTQSLARLDEWAWAWDLDNERAWEAAHEERAEGAWLRYAEGEGRYDRCALENEADLIRFDAEFPQGYAAEMQPA